MLPISFIYCTSGKVKGVTWKLLRSQTYLCQPLRNTCVTDDHEYVPFVEITIQTFFPVHELSPTMFITELSTWVTERNPIVEQEQVVLPKYLCSPLYFYWDSCCSIFSFLFSILVTVFSCSFVHYAVCLSICDIWLPHWYLQTILSRSA